MYIFTAMTRKYGDAFKYFICLFFIDASLITGFISRGRRQGRRALRDGHAITRLFRDIYIIRLGDSRYHTDKTGRQYAMKSGSHSGMPFTSRRVASFDFGIAPLIKLMPGRRAASRLD